MALVGVRYPHFAEPAIPRGDDVHHVRVQSFSFATGVGAGQQEDRRIITGKYFGRAESQGALRELHHSSPQSEDRLSTLVLPSKARSAGYVKEGTIVQGGGRRSVLFSEKGSAESQGFSDIGFLSHGLLFVD